MQFLVLQEHGYFMGFFLNPLLLLLLMNSKILILVYFKMGKQALQELYSCGIMICHL